MFDVFLDALRAVVICGILAFFIYSDKDIQHGRRGYLFIKIGFLLVAFGAILGVSDNFESLNSILVLGNTPLHSFLEKIVGYLGGFVMLAIGFWLWLPSLHTMAKIQGDLEKAQNALESELHSCTQNLEGESHKRRVAEAGQMLAEERRLALYEKAPVAISHGLIGGSLVERNKAFAAMLGYDSPEELATTAVSRQNPYITWPYHEELDRLLGLLRTKKHVRGFEARMRRKDGEIIWVNIDCTTLADREGENYYFYAFSSDITERKRAADILVESEKRLQIIMDSMPAGLFLVDADTREVVDVNVAMLAMTGYDREELVGCHCCKKLCSRGKEMCSVFPASEEIVSCEREIIKKDGSELPVIKTVAPVTLSGGEYLLETIVDISEQKRLEHLKEDVDRIVAHDLKAPIIGVINACQLLLMDQEDMEGETREMLEIIERQGRKVLRMVGMSLTIYKMETGTLEPASDTVDFHQLVNVLCQEFESTATVKDVALVVSAPEEQAFSVVGNELLYDAMFANLLSNAIEASPVGGEVVISLAPCPDMAVVLTNSGVVPREIREGFFDKYVTSGKSGGTGLGTYSAKLVVDTVGGEIFMESSDEDDVTSVTIKLPCA